jgi:hypothetical protein
MNNWCLGLKFLGNCSYDPASPNLKLISLGDGIAAIALVLTFSQLLTLPLKQRVNSVFPRVYSLWVIAVACIILSSVLPFIPGEALPLLGYPIFWELVGSILIIYGIFSLLWTFNRPLKFTKKSVERLTGLVVRVIATGEEKDFAEFALSLRKVIPDVVSTLKMYDSFDMELARRKGKPHDIPELPLKAGQLLQLCSDQAFCAAVVRKEPGFAIVLFEEIKEQRAYSNGFCKALVWELVRQALLHTDSILHREEKFRGLGFASGFTLSAFGDCEFNENVMPLSGFNLILERDLPLEVLERYSEILNLLVKVYLGSGRFYEHSYSIYSTYNHLTDYAGYISSRLDTITPDEVYRSHPYKVLSIAEKTIRKGIELLVENDKIADPQIIDYFKDVERNRDHSAFEHFAKWIYELLEALSHTKKYDMELRSILIELWLELYPVSKDGETAIHKEIQWRFEEKVLEQVKVNLEEGYYPAITRPLITVFGLHSETRKLDDDSPGVEFKKKFLLYLAEKFPALYETDPERALDKLPANVTYDVSNKRLVQYIRKGDERILQM